MTYSLLTTTTYETTKLCLIDCGDGSTDELTFPLEASEEQVLAGAVAYKESLIAVKAQQEAEAADIEANTNEQ